MARQTLETMIVLSGHVDNTFGKIGQSLTVLGSQVDQISERLISFGSDSVDMYTDYDDTLRAIKGKIGDVTAAEMDALDAQMREWAANTRYHATEVAGAVKEATTSGWKLDDIYSGIPTTMTLAAAADMDLVSAMEYLNSALAGQGKSLDESARFVDMWVKTANNGRASVEDLGESMEALGSVAMFTDSPEELFALLNQMSRFGTKGSEAGTLLRNVMLRMIAPTKHASEALKELGATEEELAELEDADLGKAAKRMEEMGLSAFDANGDLKSFIDIIEEIDRATAGLSEQEKYDILTDIFPTRTIRGIMDLLRSTRAEYDQTMATILDSEGYAQYVADLQEGGIGGARRTLESQWEELKLSTGETLSEWVEPLTDAGIGLLEWVNGMDEAKFEAIVGGLTGIAAAGPGLLIVGQAFRLIGSLATPAGLVSLSVMALVSGIGATIEYLDQIGDWERENHFGTMALDMEALQGAVSAAGQEFADAYADVTLFSGQVDAATKAYTDAATEFSSGLLTRALTGAKLTDSNEAELNRLADEMYGQLTAGISSAQAETGSFLEYIFGGEGTAEFNGDYQKLFGASDEYYSGLTEEAREIGQKVRDAMTEAFEDSEITSEERDRIMDYVDEYNALLAEVADRQSRIEYEKSLHRAQSVSRDSLIDYIGTLGESAQSDMATSAEEYEEQRATMKVSLDDQVKRGEISEAEAQRQMSVFDEQWQHSQDLILGRYAALSVPAMESALSGSDLADTMAALDALIGEFQSGDITGEQLFGMLYGEAGDSVFGLQGVISDVVHELETSFGTDLPTMIQALRVAAEATADEEKRADYLAQIDQLERMYLRDTLLNNPVSGLGGTYTGSGEAVDYSTMDARTDVARLAAQFSEADEIWKSVEGAAQYGRFDELNTALDQLDPYVRGEMEGVIRRLETNFDFAGLLAQMGISADRPNADWMAAWKLLYGSDAEVPTNAWGQFVKNTGFGVTNNSGTWIAGTEAERAKAIADWEASYLNTPDAWDLARRGQRTPWDSTAYTPGATLGQWAEKYDFSATNYNGTRVIGTGAERAKAIADYEALHTTVDVENPDEAAQEALDAMQGAMDGSPLDALVDVPNGYADGARYATEFQSALNSNPGRIRVASTTAGARGTTLRMYAEGGRADTASIFGEDGAEWAIPERHTSETARLFDMARQASGFTWGELQASSGGGDAIAGTQQLIYAPTIIANDATGVEEKLQEDKARLEKWWRERRLIEGRLSYT